MAKTPKKNAKIVLYPKQWPDTRVDKPEIDRDQPTPPLGHGYRLTKKFSEQTAPPKPGAKYTLGARMARVGSVRRGVPIATTRVEEKDMSHEDGKTFSQFVTEAAKRGRPRKLRPGEEADTLHLQDQLNKLTHPNHVEVHFKDGSKHRIPREHANMALHHLNSLKPIERADHAEHMSKSHNDFYHVLSRKSIPEKKKGISLAGPKLRKEEAELDEAKLSYDEFTKGRVTKDSDSDTLKDMIKKNNKNRGGGSRIMNRKYKEELAKRASVKEEHEDDDGWYAHKEIHGSKAISKEDWKKGVRPKKSMKKEDVEQIDEWGKQAITGPHAKTGSMSINPPKVGYKGKVKKPKVQELTREEASCGSSYNKVKASLMKKANKEKDSK